jgi:hypothetical protein
VNPVPRPSPAAREGRDLGDEYLFYDRDGDQVHVLNGTARKIFLLCDGARTTAEVAEAFSKKISDRESARRDAERIIGELADLGLISLS